MIQSDKTSEVAPDAIANGAPAFPRHGGDLAGAAARFGTPAAGWLDLSTGINPFCYPLPDLPKDVWQRLPGADADANLREAAATAWGITDAGRIVVGPGTQSLIQLLPLLRPAAPVAIVGPTYPGHAAAFALAGHAVMPCASLDEIGDAPVAVVVNPNNPDGRATDPDLLLDTAALLNERGGLLVVDESFGDLSPALSVAGTMAPGLIVLRSFGSSLVWPGCGWASPSRHPISVNCSGMGSALGRSVGRRSKLGGSPSPTGPGSTPCGPASTTRRRNSMP